MRANVAAREVEKWNDRALIAAVEKCFDLSWAQDGTFTITAWQKNSVQVK